MKNNAVTVGIGLIALCVLAIGLTGTWAFHPTSVLASVSSTQATQAHRAIQIRPAPGVPACCPNWDVVASPNVGTASNYLTSATPVPSATSGNTSTPMPCTGWNVVSSPNTGSGNNYLLSSAAVGADDIWAVGIYYDSTDRRQTLTEHWDGNNWSIVPSPNMGTSNNVLQAVVAASSNDVWAAGHWDVSGPVHQTLVEHWDGSSWSVVPSPSTGGVANILRGIAARAGNDVWAVGNICVSNCLTSRTLIEHWDGSMWSIVPSPDPGSVNGYVAVVALAANDAWATGTYSNDGTTWSNAMTHWDGTSWTLVPVTSPGSMDNDLRAFAAVSPGDIWVVGDSDSGIGERTQIQHYTGPCTTPTSTEQTTSTNTPVSGTAMPTDTPTAVQGTTNTPQPSYTPTATFTTCPIQFTDVPQDSPFYSYIRCMACRGLVNGYSSGCESGNPCFRPGNNVTRGQIAKIVANAAGLSDTIPSGRQTFDDVPNSNAFWLYIERVYAHQVIAGYPGDGVTTNPCTGQAEQAGYLYFRPCNNATRGQIAKIDAVAASYSDVIPSGQQTFDDVPVSSPFWLYIERVHLHSVISGYAGDGVTANPCTAQVEQSGHLYFRPCNNATRGQTSKIVANTFFPNCETPGAIEQSRQKR
jgi:hypothetical protein